MKSLTQHILERRHVNDSVVLLFNHIYGKLEELVNQPAQDPMFNNETRLYELFLENDKEYDIEIWFDDIKGFNWFDTQLLTYGILDDPEYQCDMVVRLEEMGTYDFGFMDRGEPLLSVNAKHFRTLRTFKRNEKAIRNTLLHELTHYLQYMGACLNGGTHQKDTLDYDRKFYDNIQNLESQNYGLMSFILYSFVENERFARVSGFYGTMITEFDKLMKACKKSLKKDPTKQEFIDYVLSDPSYNDNEIHIQHYGEFLSKLENDTYELYKKCIDNKDTIYSDDSMLYVMLNFCDHCDPKPSFLLPKKKISVFTTQTEEEYNKVKSSIIEMFKKNLNKYIKKLSDMIGDFYDEMKK